MIRKIKGRVLLDPELFARPEPEPIRPGGSFRDSSLELKAGVEVNEFGDGDTIPGELLDFLEKSKP